MNTNGENVILFLFTAIIICYLYLERKYLSTIWKKFKSFMFELSACKPANNNSPRRLSVLSLSNWQYRGEGNEYMALSLPATRQILRLRKTTQPLTKVIVNQHDEIIAANFEMLNLEYYKIVLRLIGDCYVQPADPVFVCPDEINKINSIIYSHRPEYRKWKSIGYACGALLTDYAYLPSKWDTSQFSGPTFAIELKPKQGWIAENERCYHLCTYCLNQYIKLENGEISQISKYCPMDLFSGDSFRMNFAIKCLLNTPQNNLKIFQDGVLIYGEGITTDITKILNRLSFNNVEDFCDLIVESLLKSMFTANNCSIHTVNDSTKNYTLNCSGQNLKKLCRLERKLLPRGCVLRQILRLQELDLWGSVVLSTRLKNHPYMSPEKSYIHAMDLVYRLKTNDNLVSCPKCLFMTSDDDTTVENSNIIAQQYLMSAVAKDCSLMLTYRKLYHINHKKIPKQHIMNMKNGSKYALQIGVFDLYPKPFTCTQKHAKKQIQFYHLQKRIHCANSVLLNC